MFLRVGSFVLPPPTYANFCICQHDGSLLNNSSWPVPQHVVKDSSLFFSIYSLISFSEPTGWGKFSRAFAHFTPFSHTLKKYRFYRQIHSHKSSLPVLQGCRVKKPLGSEQAPY